MTPAISLTAALLAVSLPGAAALPAAPQSISASYDVLWNGSRIAVMNETFEARDGVYRIVSESHAVGLLSLFVRQPLRLVSSGRLTASGLQPQQFEGKRGDADPRRARAEFDWPAGELRLTRDGKTDQLKLPPATQDLLSVMYQFMFLELAKLERFELSMTNGRKLNQHWYTVRAGVEIETPLGRMPTLHLVKQHQPDESGAEIWIAPQHRHLPVRMLVLDEDGTRVEHVMTRLEFKSSPQTDPTPRKPPMDADKIKDKANEPQIHTDKHR
jgi:hypothetical protein